MSEESDRMMALLEELAVLKNAKTGEISSAAARKRRKEIKREMKDIAAQKENTDD